MESKRSKSEKAHELRNALIIAAMSSAITLAGVAATNLTTWLSSAQSMRLNERQSCISRVDKQEDYARSKSDAVITSLAALATGSASPEFDEKKPSLVQELSKAGYSLMLLNNSDLGVKSGELTDWMTTHVLDYKSLPKLEFKKEEYEKLVTEWKDAFYAYIKSLDTQRTSC